MNSAHTNSYNKVLFIWGMWYSNKHNKKPDAQVKKAFNCKILLKHSITNSYFITTRTSYSYHP